MKAGHCVACTLPAWRGFVHPQTGDWHHLFPDPTSVYAVLETPEGLVVGLCYHAECAPAVGHEGPASITMHGRPLGPSTVVRLDPAPERYQYWFSPKYGKWLAAWTRELTSEFRLDEDVFAGLRAQWDADSHASSVVASQANG